MRKKNIFVVTVSVLLLGGTLALFSLNGCRGKGKNEGEPSDKPELAFSQEAPFAINIKSERSYFQARRIMRRLRTMGIDAYVLPHDSEDGEWYLVMCGAFATDSLAQNYRRTLDSAHGLQSDTVLNFQLLDSIARTPLIAEAVEEAERIDADPPEVSDTLMRILRQYPKNDLFYLRNIVFTKLENRYISKASDFSLDLPRGVSLSWLKEKGVTFFSSVIYVDNLYGNTATLQIMDFPRTSEIMKASLLPEGTNERNQKAIELCSEIADRILKSGEYVFEEKSHLSPIKAHNTLSGFRVSLTDREVTRHYLVLTDAYGEYIYTLQYTISNHGEMLDFLVGLGQSSGLEEYPEFYNSFFTNAAQQLDGDYVWGYSLEKLGWEYARARGYARWAKRMVGLWNTTTYYYNPSYGLWAVALFDLLNEENATEIYQELYLGTMDKENHRTVYGRPGAAIYNWWGDHLSEINVSVGRYVVAGGSITADFEERALIARIEQMQFERGGFRPMVAEREATPNP